MKTKKSLIRRCAIIAALTALVLGATGCGPDCEGLCNDLIDICNRAPNCSALPDEDRGQIADACGELGGGTSLCVQSCDVLDDDNKDLLESSVELADGLLSAVGC
jgi:hypothetical protein